jgi:hypothetical protein
MESQVETPSPSLAESGREAIERLNAIAPVGDIATLKALPAETLLAPTHLEKLGILSKRSQEDLRRKAVGGLPYKMIGGRVSYEVGQVLSWLESRQPASY